MIRSLQNCDFLHNSITGNHSLFILRIQYIDHVTDNMLIAVHVINKASSQFCLLLLVVIVVISGESKVILRFSTTPRVGTLNPCVFRVDCTYLHSFPQGLSQVILLGTHPMLVSLDALAFLVLPPHSRISSPGTTS